MRVFCTHNFGCISQKGKLHEINKQNYMSMPHFIVTYGPAGSGKGHIRDKYLSYLRDIHRVPFNETDTFEANIDSYVEKDERYIQRSIEATQEFITACQGKAWP